MCPWKISLRQENQDGYFKFQKKVDLKYHNHGFGELNEEAPPSPESTPIKKASSNPPLIILSLERGEAIERALSDQTEADADDEAEVESSEDRNELHSPKIIEYEELISDEVIDSDVFFGHENLSNGLPVITPMKRFEIVMNHHTPGMTANSPQLASVLSPITPVISRYYLNW